MIYGCLRIFKRYKEATSQPQQKGSTTELAGQKTKGIREQRLQQCGAAAPSCPRSLSAFCSEQQNRKDIKAQKGHATAATTTAATSGQELRNVRKIGKKKQGNAQW